MANWCFFSCRAIGWTQETRFSPNLASTKETEQRSPHRWAVRSKPATHATTCRLGAKKCIEVPCAQVGLPIVRMHGAGDVLVLRSGKARARKPCWPDVNWSLRPAQLWEALVCLRERQSFSEASCEDNSPWESARRGQPKYNVARPHSGSHRSLTGSKVDAVFVQGRDARKCRLVIVLTNGCHDVNEASCHCAAIE